MSSLCRGTLIVLSNYRKQLSFLLPRKAGTTRMYNKNRHITAALIAASPSSTFHAKQQTAQQIQQSLLLCYRSGSQRSYKPPPSSFSIEISTATAATAARILSSRISSSKQRHIQNSLFSFHSLFISSFSFSSSVLRPTATTQRRCLSSLGNPMFPHRAIPDEEPSHKNKKDDSDESFLSRHGGKVALLALAVSAALIASFVKGNSARSAVETEYNDSMPIEPIEAQELRERNRLPLNRILWFVRALRFSAYDSIIKNNNNNNTELSYASFVDFVSAVLTSTTDHPTNQQQQQQTNAGPAVKSGYLLDRLVLKYLQETQNRGKPGVSAEGNRTVDPNTKEIGGEKQHELDFSLSYSDLLTTTLPVDFLLVLLTFLMPLSQNAGLLDTESTTTTPPPTTTTKPLSLHDPTNTTTADSTSTPPATVPGWMTKNWQFQLKNGDKWLENVEMRTSSGAPVADAVRERILALYVIAASMQEQQQQQQQQQKQKQHSSLSVSHTHPSMTSTESDREKEGEKEEVWTIPETIRPEQAQAIVQLLIDTYQVPGEKMAIETGQRFPHKTYRRQTASDMIDAHLKVHKKKWKGWGAEIPANNGVKKEVEKEVEKEGVHQNEVEREVTVREFSRLLLSSQVCAWGQCYAPRATHD